MKRRRVGHEGPSSIMQRLAGFGLVPILSALAPMFVLPVVSRAGTDATWAGLSIGQGVGFVGMVVGFVGWNVRGAQAIASSSTPDERAHLLADSLWSRGLVLAVVSPVVAIASAGLAPPGGAVFAAWMGVGSALVALSSTWFGVGIGQPSFNILLDSLPRLACIGLSVPVTLLTSDPIWYPISVVAGGLAAAAAVDRKVFATWLPPLPGWSALGRSLRGSLSAAVIDPIGSIYNSAPLPLAAVAGLSGPTLAGLASADKLYRLARQGLSLFTDSLLAWVLDRDEAVRRRRGRAAAITHVSIGLLGGLALGWAGTVLTGLLFGSNLAAPRHLLWGYGCALAGSAINNHLIRYVHVPRGRSMTVAVVTAIASTAGVVTMIAVPGNVAIGLAVAEWMLVIGLLIALRLVRPGVDDGEPMLASQVQP